MNMNIRVVLLVVVASLVSFGCGSGKQIGIANAELKQMITQKAFKFEVKSVEPQITMALAQLVNSGLVQPGNTINRFDVTGEGYFIQIDGKQISANLPYYGERQMGGGYGSDAGITFNDTVEELEITNHDENQSYKIKFRVANSSESYTITIDLSNGLSGVAMVSSSHRNRIRFNGMVKNLEDNDYILAK